ncbi:B-type flagellar protein FliS [Saliniradius amylolyticus]|uniref:Flagellar secretion chaperone FliS n=1 Tax=Saliniradius amylolyticus TaxID=2183582 RepID=A0A2S2E1U6_9ALTE|nr:flagellar export chaperone FliS [Saliniradius amylolyticus]AWL11621.1 B-type flagellar protein FliS [Saliniradius amylolyticus]
MNTKVKHYQKEALKTRLAGADPYEITQMLMNGALESMKIAKINIEQKDLENKSRFLSKATSIIDSLRLSLNMEVGGEMSENLASLYAYMSERLLDASVNNDTAAIDEVIELFSGIKDAWDQIPKESREQAFQQMEQRAVASGG